jgi:hypothetical protein
MKSARHFLTAAAVAIVTLAMACCAVFGLGWLVVRAITALLEIIA